MARKPRVSKPKPKADDASKRTPSRGMTNTVTTCAHFLNGLVPVVTGVPLARDDMHSPRATVKHTPCNTTTIKLYVSLTILILDPSVRNLWNIG